jgi:hypothetical protein
MSEMIADPAIHEKHDDKEDAPCAMSSLKAKEGVPRQGMQEGELEGNKKKKAKLDSTSGDDSFKPPPTQGLLVLVGDTIKHVDDMTTSPTEISVGGDGCEEGAVYNPSGDGVTWVFKKPGNDDATGKLWWEQQGESLERQASLLDIESFKPETEPILWRIRKGRQFRIRAGSSILNDGEDRWCIKEEEEPRFKCGNPFGALPRNLIQEILSMVIVRPRDHNSIARSCREFSRICEDRRFVARTAAVITSAARLASQHATENALTARIKANATKVKVIRFDPGEWRGVRSNAKQPSGFGVFTDATTGSWSAGQWRKSGEHGPCEAKYADGAVYAGDMDKGQRHGNGVARTGTWERYEGSWSLDERHGYGILFGGYWPFLFGRYKENQPVGVHIGWNMRSDTVLVNFYSDDDAVADDDSE